MFRSMQFLVQNLLYWDGLGGCHPLVLQALVCKFCDKGVVASEAWVIQHTNKIPEKVIDIFSFAVLAYFEVDFSD